MVSSDRFFKVLGRPNSSACSRLGMAVSRQIDKRAVGRNRIKRVIRESFRHSLQRQKEPGTAGEGESIKPHTGVDLVVLPRRECASICNRQLFRSLDKHWLRITQALEQRKERSEQNTTSYRRIPGETGRGNNITMGNLRPVLAIGLVFLGYMLWVEWQKDYGPGPDISETTSTQASTGQSVPAVPGGLTGDLPEPEEAGPSAQQSAGLDAVPGAETQVEMAGENPRHHRYDRCARGQN